MDLESIIVWVQSAPAWSVYVAVFLASLVENVFPPIPGDAIIIFAGFICAGGEASLALCLLCALAGNLAGGWIMYRSGPAVLALAHRVNEWIGRPRLLHRFLEDLSSDRRMERVRTALQRYGAWLVVVSRFLAGIRYFVSIVAGLGRMSPLSYLVSFGTGVVVWNALLLSLGRQLGANWRLAVNWIQFYTSTALSLFLIVLLIALLLYWRRQRRANRAAP
ncbi:MAG: DedA family protein [Leptospirales bacterium]|nr:DedA family protein [Leptospirales bacterium]